MSRPVIYVIGSLRNPRVPEVANALRAEGYDVFDDWYAVGKDADEAWQQYEQGRGRTYPQALRGEAAKNTFEFDYRHLKRCHGLVMVGPAGKSAFGEACWAAGQNKPVWVLFEQDPERWDVMLRFVFTGGGGVCSSLSEVTDRMADYFGDWAEDMEIPF